MLASIISVLVLCIIAGLINGSFATPIKVMNKWQEENIWLPFSILAFFVFPVLTILFFDPKIFTVITQLPAEPVIVVLVGGLIYGIGQVCMTFAFRLIGIGLSFVITISICTAGGALIPICWNLDKLISTYFLLQVIGVIIFLIAVIFSYKAGLARDKEKGLPAFDKNLSRNNFKYLLIFGVILAGISGIGGAVEGTAFAYSNSIISGITPGYNLSGLESQLISWCLLFSAAGIPFVVFFLAKLLRNSTANLFYKEKTLHYWALIIIMGFCYWISIVVFCKASDVLGGNLAPTIAWPLFMIAIISTSNFWSIISGEWKGSGRKAIKMLCVCLLLSITAVVVFSISSGFAAN
jgi:L-rhamnose-H+ transport protein